MNKRLMLAIILVSMIPGILASARGISGFLVANASDLNTSNNVSSNASQVVNIVPGAYTVPNSGYASFYALATVILIIAMAYLLKEYRKEEKRRISAKAKIVKKTHTARKENKGPFDPKALFGRIKFSKMSNDKAEKYMVFLVGAVALVGILVMLLR